MTIPTVTAPDTEALVIEVERWLGTINHRTWIDARELRELSTLFLDIWGVLTNLNQREDST